MATDTHTLLTQMTNDLAVTSDAIQRLCRRRGVLRELATKLRTGAHPAIVEAELEVKLPERTSSAAAPTHTEPQGRDSRA